MKIKQRLLNFSTFYVIAFIVYFIYCLLDSLIPPTTSKLLHIEVYEESNGKIIYSQSVGGSSKEDTTIPIPLKPNMTISGTYEITRHYNGTNNIERLIVGGDKEYPLFYTRRNHVAGTTGIVSATYLIPVSLLNGCNYSTLSKNYHTKRWNIITYIAPKVTVSTPIYFCIEK